MRILVFIDSGEFASQTLTVGRGIKTLCVDVQSALNQILVWRADFRGMLVELV